MRASQIFRTAATAARAFSSQAKSAPQWKNFAAVGALAGTAGLAVGLTTVNASAGTFVEVTKGDTTVKVNLSNDDEDGSTTTRRVNKIGLDNFPRWFRKSVSGTTLTPEDYEKNCNKVGPRGYTFDEAIQCGIDTESGTGMAIPDEESYYLWQEWYDKMIEARHGHAPGAIHTTDLDYTKLDSSKLPSDLNKYCVSTRIRAARNVSGYGLPPGTTRAERRAVEALCKKGLETLTGELGGKYFSLTDMSKAEEDQLQADHFLFQKPNSKAMISGCGGCRDWPDARGIYHNVDKTFLVWVNEEDQMRVISMQKGGDVVEVFTRWVNGVNAVEKVIQADGKKFMQNEHVGMFSSCVSNLGTGLRASMHILLPGLVSELGVDGINDLATKMEMQCRGAGGEHTAAGPGGRVDLSNNLRIGKSEVELVQTMVDGIATFIELEKKCENGVDIAADVKRIMALTVKVNHV